MQQHKTLNLVTMKLELLVFKQLLRQIDLLHKRGRSKTEESALRIRETSQADPSGK
ncbi:hypothetical protein TorRG33x02_350610, partial [Trema orientale]